MPLLDHRHIDRMLPGRSIKDAGEPIGAQNDSLLDRARFLPSAQRVLVELAFDRQLSHRQIGVIVGIPAGTVTRRLQRICRRLRDPMIVMLMHERCPLPPEQRELALEHFLHRRSTKLLAGQRGLSYHETRRSLDYVRGWFRGISQRQARPT